MAHEQELRRRTAAAIAESRALQQQQRAHARTLAQQRKEAEAKASAELSRMLEEEEVHNDQLRRQRAQEVDAFRRRQMEYASARTMAETNRSLARDRAMLGMLEDDSAAAFKEALAKAKEQNLDTRPLYVGYNRLKNPRFS